jgi:hypothetical protein
MQLSSDQQQRVEDLLRRRGERCPHCGEWQTVTSNGVAYRTANQRISVQYVCTNRDVEHPNPAGYGPWSVPLDPHEARRVGLG